MEKMAFKTICYFRYDAIVTLTITKSVSERASFLFGNYGSSTTNHSV
jgi:hypothetical protein